MIVLIYVRYKFLEDYLCYIKLLKVEIKNKIYVKCFNYINKWYVFYVFILFRGKFI